MPTYVFGNFFATELLVGITPSTTVLSVPPSATLQLPAFALVDVKEARLTLWDGQLPPEIVACTVNPQTGSLTVVRGKEGTTPQSWPAGTQIVSSLTQEVMNAALAAYFDFNVVLAASFLRLTGGTLTGPLILAGAPSDPNGAATKTYVDSVQGTGLPLSGGTMQGDINMNSHTLLNLPAPSVGSNPATKTYADSLVTSPTNLLKDISGQIVAGGTNAAYTFTSFEVPGAYVNGKKICIQFGVTNAASATLNMDSLGARPINVETGVAIPAGILVPGAPTSLTYNAVATAWMLDEVKFQRGSGINITQATAETIVAKDDQVLISDTSASGVTRKMIIEDLFMAFAQFTTETVVAAGDLLCIFDVSAGDVRAMTAENVIRAGRLSTYQRLTSGSGATYTRPSSPAPRRLKITMAGAGGGGGARIAANGSVGADTVFESWVAKGGAGGLGDNNNGGAAGGTGGANGTGTLIRRIPGGSGGNGTGTQNTIAGGDGGNTPIYGGRGAGNMGGSVIAQAGKANTGGGGGGEGDSLGSAGGGGGSGEVVEFFIDNPSATYTYTIGAGGAGGISSAGSAEGGAGGSGIIDVEEIY